MERLPGECAWGFVIKRITEQWMANIAHMDADLVGAAGFKVQFKVGEPRIVGESAVMGHRAFTGREVDSSLNERAVETGDGGINGTGWIGFAKGEGLVSTVDFARAHGL